MTPEQIARICHEANRAYCQAIGDYSQPTWEEAPVWQRESACNGVNHILANPHATPEDSHNSWLEQKRKDGWVYGEVKDPEAKQHPCMVEYSQLPPDQRRKDALFISIVRAFIPKEALE